MVGRMKCFVLFDKIMQKNKILFVMDYTGS